MKQLKPALQYSEGRSRPWSGARLTNCFAEAADGDKTADYAVMAIPGFDLFASLGSFPVRGVHSLANTVFVVSGESLFTVDSNGTVVSVGTVLGSNPVRMFDNGSQIGIVADAGQGYVWDGGAVVVPPGLPPVSDGTFIDGYFVWTVLDSDQFIISGLGDGLTYDPLDVATVEGSPDPLVGVINNHRELQFYGSRSIEIWYNSGAADFPFERQGNAFIERGCIARDTIVKFDNSVVFVGEDRIVYRLDGYSPVRISTHAIEYHIALSSSFRAYVYSQEGHKFYALTLDAGTFVYDAPTGAWHERSSLDLQSHRVGSATVTGDGSTVMGDAFTGKLYTPNLDRYDENGMPIQMIIELPDLSADRDRVTMHAFELYCETGVGSAEVADPQAMLCYSDDGGRTWSNELWRSLGKIGEYRTRAIWRTLGQFRVRQMKITITDAVRRLVMGYWADIR